MGENAKKREEEMKKEQSSLKRDQELRTFARITDQEDFEREMAEKQAKMEELQAQIDAEGSPEHLKAREKRQRDDKFRRDLEYAEEERFLAQMKRLNAEGAALDSQLPMADEEQKAEINRIINDGGSSQDVSNFLRYGSETPSYTPRQQAAIERSLGRFGDTDAGSDAIMKGLKFDEEGVLVDPSAPKPKPMPKVGELTHEQFLKAQQSKVNCYLQFV